MANTEMMAPPRQVPDLQERQEYSYPYSGVFGNKPKCLGGISNSSSLNTCCLFFEETL